MYLKTKIKIIFLNACSIFRIDLVVLHTFTPATAKMQIYLKNYDFCKYVEYGAISWKYDIFVNNCVIEVQI